MTDISHINRNFAIQDLAAIIKSLKIFIIALVTPINSTLQRYMIFKVKILRRKINLKIFSKK